MSAQEEKEDTTTLPSALDHMKQMVYQLWTVVEGDPVDPLAFAYKVCKNTVAEAPVFAEQVLPSRIGNKSVEDHLKEGWDGTLCWEDGKRDQKLFQEHLVFNPKVHKKYHANTYFFTDKGGTLYRMKDNPGRVEAKQAYDDFLLGLEIVGQQADLQPHKVVSRDELLVDASIVQTAEEFTKIPTDPKEMALKIKELNRMAEWERSITRRKRAIQGTMFSKNLERRATMERHGCRTLYDPVNKSILPPINHDTFTVLTRPPEPNWSLGTFLGMVYSMWNYTYNLAVQIIAISMVCSAPFYCGVTTGTPIPAPYAAMRGPVQYASGDVWSKVHKALPDPGYVIEWPYMTTLNADSTVSFSIPPELLAKCELKRKNTTLGAANDPSAKWSWDPFEQRLIPEYLDCTKQAVRVQSFGSNLVGGGHDVIQFTNGKHVFYYDTNWYEGNSKAVQSCVQRIYGTVIIPTVAGSLIPLSTYDSNEVLKNYNEALAAFERGKVTNKYSSLVTCMQQGVAASTRCECHAGAAVTKSLNDKFNSKFATAWQEWLLESFYIGETAPKYCSQGSEFKYQACNVDSECRNGGDTASTCAVKYESQSPLNQSWKYGCFFQSPTATKTSEVLNSCGVENKEDVPGRVSESYNSKNERKMWSITPLSAQGSLILVLLVKEGGYVTAGVLVGIVILITAVILLILDIFIRIYQLILRCSGSVHDDHDIQELKQMVFQPIVSGVSPQLRIIWNFCLGFSCLYRSLTILVLLARGTANASINTMDSTITNIANLVYSLLVFIVLGGSDYSGLTLGMVSALVGLIFTLSSQRMSLTQIQSVLEDLNENRLSKFEIALSLTKIMEIFLENDIQYNWVEHFYSGPSQKLKPHYEELPSNRDLFQSIENQLLCGDNPSGKFPDWKRDLVEGKQWGLQGGHNYWKRRMITILPALDEDLAVEFGHDGIGTYDESIDSISKDKLEALKFKAKNPPANKCFCIPNDTPPSDLKFMKEQNFWKEYGFESTFSRKYITEPEAPRHDSQARPDSNERREPQARLNYPEDDPIRDRGAANGVKGKEVRTDLVYPQEAPSEVAINVAAQQTRSIVPTVGFIDVPAHYHEDDFHDII